MNREILIYLNILETIKNLKIFYDKVKLESNQNSFLDIMALDSETQSWIKELQKQKNSIDNNIDCLINDLEISFQKLNTKITQRVSSLQHKEIWNNFISGSIAPTALTEKEREEIGITFSKFTNPQFPMLQINSSSGLFTKYLVAAEPVFILDWNQKSIAETKACFNSVYQNRLCIYKIDIRGDLFLDKINDLPYKQFNFILVWDLVKFMQDYQITYLLQKLKNLIRPGGTIIFNYNNCDKLYGADNYDQKTGSYQTEQTLRNVASNCNYTVSANCNYNNIDWFEIKSSGTLYTLKKQSTLPQLFSK